MPEGDSIHGVAEALAPRLVGRSVVRLALQARGELASMAGEHVTDVSALGKHLVIRLSGGWGLRVHLGMKGRWRVYEPGARLPPWVQRGTVLLETADAIYSCTRARAELVRGLALDRNRALARVGPDLLGAELELDEVLARARGPGHGRRAIAELLLDQWIASGLGNVYKSELLFLHRLDPWMRARAVPDDTLRQVYATGRELLAANVGPGARVTVARPERRVAAPQQEARLWVYGRHHQPCLRCRTVILVRRQGDAARSTYWCPTCQPAASDRVVAAPT